MKRVLVCLAVFFLIEPAIAGEDPYVAIIGKDANANACTFCFSPKHLQFMSDHIGFGVPQYFGTIPVYNQYFRAKIGRLELSLSDALGI